MNQLISSMKSQWVSVLIVLWLVITPLLGKAPVLGADRTTVSNPWTFSADVTLSGSGTDLTIGGDASVGDDLTVTGDNINVNSIGIQYSHTSSLTTSTTTVCSFQSPSATSTLDTFSINFTVGSSSAKTIQMFKGATQGASTTVFSVTGGTAGSPALAANAQGAFMASTTPEAFARIISPSNWVGVSMLGGTGLDSPTGTCTAVFTAI